VKLAEMVKIGLGEGFRRGNKTDARGIEPRQAALEAVSPALEHWRPSVISVVLAGVLSGPLYNQGMSAPVAQFRSAESRSGHMP